jgi:hypothetical protein
MHGEYNVKFCLLMCLFNKTVEGGTPLRREDDER